MNRPTYPATWPGTNIIKSQHNAFNWQADTSDSIFARDYVNCTALFNQWRAAQKASHLPDQTEARIMMRRKGYRHGAGAEQLGAAL